MKFKKRSQKNQKIVNPKKIFVVILLLLSLSQIFSQSIEIESYKKGKIPQWAKDLRRTEIITFGSLPFVTIWTTLAYSAFTKGAIVNPFSSDSSEAFNEDDQKKVVAISCAISLALGIVDLAINLSERAIEKNKIKRQDAANAIVAPVLEGESIFEDPKIEIPEYLEGGFESAVF